VEAYRRSTSRHLHRSARAHRRLPMGLRAVTVPCTRRAAPRNASCTTDTGCDRGCAFDPKCSGEFRDRRGRVRTVACFAGIFRGKCTTAARGRVAWGVVGAPPVRHVRAAHSRRSGPPERQGGPGGPRRPHVILGQAAGDLGQAHVILGQAAVDLGQAHVILGQAAGSRPGACDRRPGACDRRPTVTRYPNGMLPARRSPGRAPRARDDPAARHD
jgi:hypothetical protein